MPIQIHEELIEIIENKGKPEITRYCVLFEKQEGIIH
jgi:hypothetical protein